ncbi:MAG: hypothetical protein A2231_07720 [Candidatus Firestonebacteria bacterium RIFOXYA2_FULL_40_8]|nr:MAG: hypothetical protein A2231_07720 [Candidatus Firestonebacteria bacterium RIFOXYA2_FULL_40_8]
MLKRTAFLIVSVLLSAVIFAQGEDKGRITVEQKQMPENKGMITIDIPESKKNVNVSPEKITPPDKTETIIKTNSSDEKAIIRTPASDNEKTFPGKPKLNYQGKYYIPQEGTTEWFAEANKNNTEGIKWESFCDDIFINRPGDTWTDMTKTFNFQFATTVSALAFLSFTQVDNLKTEARFKGFLVTTAIITGLELINSSHPNQHFCAKNFTAGVAGSLCGSFVLTVGFGF